VEDYKKLREYELQKFEEMVEQVCALCMHLDCSFIAYLKIE